MIKNVSIFGFSEANRGEPLYQDAFKTAELLASNGYVIVNGGGPGVMRASSEGAKEGGGKAIGVTYYPQDATHFEGKDAANPIDEEITCANYLERTLTLIKMGDAFIFFNGATGTISEFGMAWGLARIYFGRHKPLIFYGDFWYDIIESIAENMLLREEELRVYTIVNSPRAALEAIKNADKSPY
ncbi:LOG family protein [Candidatus Shapirobacteria bacterium]|nr:LOG family protein [Candidatus Shapirobacteria bacterium]